MHKLMKLFFSILIINLFYSYDVFSEVKVLMYLFDPVAFPLINLATASSKLQASRPALICSAAESSDTLLADWILAIRHRESLVEDNLNYRKLRLR